MYSLEALTSGVIWAHRPDGPFLGNFVEKYSNSSISLYNYLIKMPVLSRRKGLSENLGAF